MLRKQAEKAVASLKSRLEALADGYVEIVEVDEPRGAVWLKLVGGRFC